MAIYTFDLRGAIGDHRPEETLGEKWKAELPKADRFGVHTILQYEFLRSPTTQAVVSGDSLSGIIGVPKDEVWELFSLGQVLTLSAAATLSQVKASIATPPVARWEIQTGRWVIGSHPDLPITRPKNYAGSTSVEASDEASDITPGSGLRKRLLYSQSALKASMDCGNSITVLLWLITLDVVRYPSNERLLAMLDSGEITRSELLADLALRYPSPPEAS